MKYHFKVHKEENMFWAECLELEGCNTQGKTKEDLFENMKEVLDLYLDEPEDSKKVFPKPNSKLSGRNVVAVPVDPRISWAVLLRNARLNRGMTQKEAAKALNIKNLYAYQKLESSKTANPELATMIRIKKVFPELNLEDILSA